MIKSIGARYVIVVGAAVAVWFFTRSISPAFITFVALLIFVASTIWFIFSIAKAPARIGENSKRWWRLFWDAFWGL